MPNKPPELETWDASDAHYSHGAVAAVSFSNGADMVLFQDWLETHGWKSFQSYWELKEVKNEPHQEEA